MGLRTHAALWASLLLLAFFYIGFFYIGADLARIVINSLVIGAHLSVCLTWWGRFKHAVRTGIKDGAQNIYFGVWLTSFFTLTYFTYLIVVITLGRPDWIRLSPIGGTFSVGFFLGAASLLLTPLNTRDVLEEVSLRWWFFAVGIGGVTAGVLMTLAFLGILTLSG